MVLNIFFVGIVISVGGIWTWSGAIPRIHLINEDKSRLVERRAWRQKRWGHILDPTGKDVAAPSQLTKNTNHHKLHEVRRRRFIPSIDPYGVQLTDLQHSKLDKEPFAFYQLTDYLGSIALLQDVGVDLHRKRNERLTNLFPPYGVDTNLMAHGPATDPDGISYIKSEISNQNEHSSGTKRHQRSFDLNFNSNFRLKHSLFKREVNRIKRAGPQLDPIGKSQTTGTKSNRRKKRAGGSYIIPTGAKDNKRKKRAGGVIIPTGLRGAEYAQLMQREMPVPKIGASLLPGGQKGRLSADSSVILGSDIKRNRLRQKRLITQLTEGSKKVRWKRVGTLVDPWGLSEMIGHIEPGGTKVPQASNSEEKTTEDLGFGNRNRAKRGAKVTDYLQTGERLSVANFLVSIEPNRQRKRRMTTHRIRGKDDGIQRTESNELMRYKRLGPLIDPWSMRSSETGSYIDPNGIKSGKTSDYLDQSTKFIAVGISNRERRLSKIGGNIIPGGNNKD